MSGHELWQGLPRTVDLDDGSATGGAVGSIAVAAAHAQRFSGSLAATLLVSHQLSNPATIPSRPTLEVLHAPGARRPTPPTLPTRIKVAVSNSPHFETARWPSTHLLQW